MFLISVGITYSVDILISVHCGTLVETFREKQPVLKSQKPI